VLYVVIAAGALALVLWGERSDEPQVGWIERTLAVFVVLYAIGALYTPDLARRRRRSASPRSVRAALRAAAARALGPRADRALRAGARRLALAFVAVAAVEYASRRLLFHTALNSNQRFFRVNSLFYDPNIYGRFLALTMVAVAASMMWESRRRRVALAAAVLAVLWLGLLGSVSQSSIVALLAGLAVIAAVRFPPRATAAAVVLVLVVVAAVAIGDSGRLHLNLSDTSSANNATSGRASLVKEGASLFSDRRSRASAPARSPVNTSGTWPARGLPVRVALAGGRDLGLAHDAITIAAEQARSGCSPMSRYSPPRWRRWVAARCAGGRRVSRSSPPSSRWSCTPGPTRTSSRIRSPGRCWRSDRAGARVKCSAT